MQAAELALLRLGQDGTLEDVPVRMLAAPDKGGKKKDERVHLCCVKQRAE
jgi:hypothetical protein